MTLQYPRVLSEISHPRHSGENLCPIDALDDDRASLSRWGLLPAIAFMIALALSLWGLISLSAWLVLG